jgi:hypothetical protein
MEISVSHLSVFCPGLIFGGSYAECRALFIIMLSVIMLNVITLSVIEPIGSLGLYLNTFLKPG